MKIIFLIILFTQNNIFLTLSTYKGEIIFWKSIGSLKIKGVKKLSNSLIKNFIYFSLKNLQEQKNLKFHVKFKGLNRFKKNFIRFLFTHFSFSILSFEDVLIRSNNGCKLKKKRRL